MPEPEHPSPDRFIVVAGVFEGSLALVAVALGWALGLPPMEHVSWTATAVGWGTLAAGPLLLLFGVTLRLPLAPLRRILRLLDDFIVPLFRPHSLLAIGIVCLLAGLGEEMLFRGVVQPAIAAISDQWWGDVVGLAVASLLFGLAHAITPTYVILATLIGAYMGALWLISENLVVPIVAHAVYDFVAVVYLAKFRAGTSRRNEASSDGTAEDEPSWTE